ncbi:hypothetical protein T484DRAFT_3631870 [Baffinella frigidus]|nr:hypothetical protein T484DRAFT_3631870 [Cryptophyta sp. CCMP2293]
MSHAPRLASSSAALPRRRFTGPHRAWRCGPVIGMDRDRSRSPDFARPRQKRNINGRFLEKIPPRAPPPARPPLPLPPGAYRSPSTPTPTWEPPQFLPARSRARSSSLQLARLLRQILPVSEPPPIHSRSRQNSLQLSPPPAPLTDQIACPPLQANCPAPRRQLRASRRDSLISFPSTCCCSARGLEPSVPAVDRRQQLTVVYK